MTLPPWDVHTHLEEHARRIKAYTDARIRAALIQEGVDPDAVERVARRAQAGEFDPPTPMHTITEDTQ